MSSAIPPLPFRTTKAARLEAAPPTGPETTQRLSELNRNVARMVDTFIYDYPKLVRDEPAPFARATKDVSVAIVGSGFAGLTAAYELRRAGIREIDVFEARDEVGGRAKTGVFQGPDGAPYFNEMGPMRVPENSKLFWHYLAELQPGEDPPQKIFPNPGVVATEILYQGRNWIWGIGEDLPEPWLTIQNNIVQFIDEALTYRGGGRVLKLKEIVTILTQDEELSPAQIDDVKAYWSFFLEKYEDVPFVAALSEFFDGRDGRPRWTAEQFNMFSTLGMGTGGFGPLFPVCFLEIFRLFLWEYQFEYSPNLPMAKIIERFLEHVEPTLHKETVTYVGIDKKDPTRVNVYSLPRSGTEDGKPKRRQYDFVIVATTLRSMQVRMNLDGPVPPKLYASESDAVFGSPASSMVRHAIRVPHIMNSSKLFGFLKEKPWKSDSAWPHASGEPIKCVLTDVLARQMYFLDPYPDNPNAGSNVLISYNWGDDSVKIMAVEDYAPHQIVTPGANPTYALKMAYQYGMESSSLHDHVAQALAQITVADQDDYLQSIIWQKEPMIFGAFKIDYPQQYHYTSQLVYQYQDARFRAEPNAKRVFLANNNCSFQGGWIEGAMQSAVNAAAAVLLVMKEDGQAEDFRMTPLFQGNPFEPVLGQILNKYQTLRARAAADSRASETDP